MMFGDSRGVERLESLVAQMFRLGVVVSTNPVRKTVRVRIPDADDLVTNDLPVVVRSAARDQDYWMPDVGDQAVCLFFGNGLEEGVCLGVIYSEPSPVKIASQDKAYLTFEDGTHIEYDRAAHHLTADVKGSVEVLAETSIDARAGTTITATAGGDITAEAGGTIVAQAGQSITATAPGFITLTAPQINLNGNQSSSGQDGSGTATATENADRTINGSLTVNGPLVVNGNSTVSGNSAAGTRTGGPCPHGG